MRHTHDKIFIAIVVFLWKWRDFENWRYGEFVYFYVISVYSVLRHTVYHISLERLDHESAKIKLRDLKKSQKREKKVTAEKKPVYSISNSHYHTTQRR